MATYEIQDNLIALCKKVPDLSGIVTADDIITDVTLYVEENGKNIRFDDPELLDAVLSAGWRRLKLHILDNPDVMISLKKTEIQRLRDDQESSVDHIAMLEEDIKKLKMEMKSGRVLLDSLYAKLTKPLLDILFPHGVNFNTRYTIYEDLFFDAVAERNVDVMEDLLKRGANVYASVQHSSKCWNALTAAIYSTVDTVKKMNILFPLFTDTEQNNACIGEWMIASVKDNPVYNNYEKDLPSDVRLKMLIKSGLITPYLKKLLHNGKFDDLIDWVHTDEQRNLLRSFRTRTMLVNSRTTRRRKAKGSGRYKSRRNISRGAKKGKRRSKRKRGGRK